MSDFPRGWTLSVAVGAGTAASITVPAIAGVVHVLDGFSARLLAGGGGSVQISNVLLNSSDGVFAAFVLAQLFTTAANTIDNDSGSGLDLAAGPGASLTVAFQSAAGVGNDQILLIQGHDI